MRRSKKRRPEVEEKLNQADRKFREARGRLRWRVDQALVPLAIQEEKGISQLQGGVLIISYDRNLRTRIKDVLVSENYRCDEAWGSNRAVGMLRLVKYDLIVVDYTRYRRSNIFSYVSRYQPHVKVISIVSDNRGGQDMMRRGGYSYLMGRNFDTEQLRICLISSLRLKHSVCTLLKNGERCNRSCVNNYQTEDDLLDFDDIPEH